MTQVLSPALEAITIFVADKERSKGFYARAFAVPPIFEDDHSVVFAFGQVVVNLLIRSQADELVAPARVAEADGGASFQLTIPVADVEAACALLAERDVELLNGPIDRSWGLRTAAFADPDGTVWEVAQPLNEQP